MVDCIHHWYLGASNKGIVHAKCRKCKAEKDFSNIPVNKFAITGNKTVAPPPVTTE